MNNKCTEKNEEKNKVRNNDLEKLKFIEQTQQLQKHYWINLQTPCTILKDQEFC